jgi:cyclophilin family peptidyl-prolyl cis-trans isomerase
MRMYKHKIWAGVGLVSIGILAGCGSTTPTTPDITTLNSPTPVSLPPVGDATAAVFAKTGTPVPTGLSTGAIADPIKGSATNSATASSTNPLATTKTMKTYTSAPAMTIDTKKSYTATLKTSMGEIEIELFANKVPNTVNNFVFLARDAFYDKTVFHRVIKDFMIQGGDPKGDGTGGPGYRFNDEKFSGEYTKGTVAMANAGPNTNGSQFFIMHKDVGLPKNYVIFGKVIKGLDVVDKIAAAEVASSAGGERSKPVRPLLLESVTVSEK